MGVLDYSALTPGAKERLLLHEQVVRMDQAKIIDINDFGAVGNGMKDCTLAVQSAINCLVPGATLYVPRGIFLVSGLTALNLTSCKIHFDGMLKAKNLISDLLIIEACNFMTITNLRIDGAKDTEVSVFNGLTIKESSDCFIDNAFIANCLGDGISIKENAAKVCKNVHIADCFIQNNKKAGIRSNLAKNLMITGSVVGGNGTVTTPNAGIEVTNSTDIMISDCIVGENHNPSANILTSTGIIRTGNIGIVNDTASAEYLRTWNTPYESGSIKVMPPNKYTEIGSACTDLPVAGSFVGIRIEVDTNTSLLLLWNKNNSTAYSLKEVNNVWDTVWAKDWNSLNDGSGSGMDTDLFRGLAPSAFSRAYSGANAFGGDALAMTTEEFLTLLDSYGAFAQPHWIARGSWSYATNKYITDTGCGNIHLAGCAIEVISAGKYNCTIKVTTPTTSSLGVTHTEFVYINNGPTYMPGWRKTWNNVNDGIGSGMDTDLVQGVNIMSNVGTHANAVNMSKLMAWKNYGNNHVIFDASASTAPNGAAVNSSNPTNKWVATHPTLMGWNGSATYGVRVDSARNADTLGEKASSAFASTAEESRTAPIKMIRTGGDAGWATTNLELRAMGNTPPGIGFHRSGVTACTLHEEAGELFWRANGGATSYKMFNAYNYGLDYLVGASFTLSAAHNHRKIIVSGIAIVITIPTGLPADFDCIVVNDQSGAYTFAVNAGIGLYAPAANTKRTSDGPGSWASVCRYSGNETYFLCGNLKV